MSLRDPVTMSGECAYSFIRVMDNKIVAKVAHEWCFSQEADPLMRFSFKFFSEKLHIKCECCNTINLTTGLVEIVKYARSANPIDYDQFTEVIGQIMLCHDCFDEMAGNDFFA